MRLFLTEGISPPSFIGAAPRRERTARAGRRQSFCGRTVLKVKEISVEIGGGSVGRAGGGSARAARAALACPNSSSVFAQRARPADSMKAQLRRLPLQTNCPNLCTFLEQHHVECIAVFELTFRKH
ncbi:hypothetical protein EVAR_62269_1 [Eumeta japonica]|uniref:Uncharacterized protein n=1 Tax=Eumeta variegata TaxID=151549 RepID=A0A4C1Z180_EUMVA|nr:hypothetical protein EVAR_62269_1 [Eumeta japonica]